MNAGSILYEVYFTMKRSHIIALTASGILLVCGQVAAVFAHREFQSAVYVWESDIANRRKLYAPARAAANHAVELNPLNGYAMFFVATNSFLLEKHDQAIKEFKQSLRYMPHAANVLRLLGQAYFYKQNYAESSNVFTRFFLMNPLPKVTPEYLFRLQALALYRSRQYGGAATIFVDAEKFNQHRAELLQLRVVNALLLNQITMADYLYRRFRFKFPDNRIIPAEILARSLEGNKLRSSTRFFETMRMRGDADPSTLKILALAYSKKDRFDEAATVLHQATQATPADAELYLMLGDVCYKMERWQESADNYVKHLQLMPKSPLRAEIEKKLVLKKPR